MKKIVLLLLLTLGLSAKTITPNDVYAQVMLLKDEIHYLLNYYNIKHDHDGILKRVKIHTKLKPRNVWQKSYEIMVKINILRNEHKLPTIEPINMAPVLNLNPDLVFEQTQRILTELHIFKKMVGIKEEEHKNYNFKGKTPLDVYNGLSHISASLDELNKGGVTPSFVFGENMRIYDDISLILQHFNIDDKTIPAKRNIKATPTDTFNVGIKTLEKVKQLQIIAGIDFVDFNGFKKDKQTPSEVFSISQMLIAELQTIKAYIGIDTITPAATSYKTKTPVEVHQLMSWNLRKLELINSLSRGK